MRTILILILLIAATLWWYGLKRAATLFTIKVRGGKIKITQGRIPPRLYREIAEIVVRTNVTRAKIRGVTRDGRPVLHFEGEMTPNMQQQMRNIMGQFTTGEIRSGNKE